MLPAALESNVPARFLYVLWGFFIVSLVGRYFTPPQEAIEAARQKAAAKRAELEQQRLQFVKHFEQVASPAELGGSEGAGARSKLLTLCWCSSAWYCKV